MKDSIKNITIDEVKKKISNIQERYSFQIDWENSNETQIISIDTEKWSDAGSVAKGGRFKAIENISDSTPSNSIVFYAPKGSKIDPHSHPQMEFCICLSGKLMFILSNNEHYILEPIESIYVQPDDVHEIQFIEDSQIIVTWNPKIVI